MASKLIFDDEDGDDSFTINTAYAKRYEATKKHQEFTQLREKYGDDYEEEESTDEEEDEVGELVTPEVDAQIMRTISLIRARKPEVYDEKKNFFSGGEKGNMELEAAWPEVGAESPSYPSCLTSHVPSTLAEEEMQKARSQWKEKSTTSKLGVGAKKHYDTRVLTPPSVTHLQANKPMRLKDYHRQNLLDGVTEGEEKEKEGRRVWSHAEEQNKIKQELRQAAHAGDEDDDEGDFLTIRSKSKEEKDREEEEYRNFLLENMASEGSEGLKDWKSYGKAQEADPEEEFLMDYILNRGWMDKTQTTTPTYDEIVSDGEDEEAVDAAEDFERAHNFRFEEADAAQLTTHARNIEGSMRRKDDRRKKARESRLSRKDEEKQKKTEELKRLKNLKKEELRQKLLKIQEISGGEVGGFDEVDLEKDFEPEEHDAKMQDAFGDQYYDAEDANVKPDFGDDIDISDILPDGPKGYGAGDEEAGDWEGGEEEHYEGGEEQYHEGEGDGTWYEDTAGEENFIMDADYLPGGQQFNGPGADNDG
ncbi:KRI1-like family-domain-containing protein [Blyttiomyces helicus]|uniref:KRI1-like family-domain-containing protein n=1 Tax=Blyttiomyces helicus TaxID=388810 RepID=A0A4P9W0J6_9FUNG|nr:KRI1-like family-domain-containing protein [Blyttiomyces helicus]|eukprot:RKO85162.1 KRI1-like family-domain-containing protein [Blyttiomyces helicus]